MVWATGCRDTRGSAIILGFRCCGVQFSCHLLASRRQGGGPQGRSRRGRPRWAGWARVGLANAEGGPGCGLSSPGQVSPRRPLSAPLPQGGPSTAWLRWTPRLRLGEYTEDSVSVSLCLWIGCRVTRMCCPFEKSDLSSQVVSSSLSAFFLSLLWGWCWKQLEISLEQGLPEFFFFFFPLKDGFPFFLVILLAYTWFSILC